MGKGDVSGEYLLLSCEARGCLALADWAFIGEGGDLYLCAFHGGKEPVEGWTWIGAESVQIDAMDLLADEWPDELGWTDWDTRRRIAERLVRILNSNDYAIVRAEHFGSSSEAPDGN